MSKLYYQTPWLLYLFTFNFPLCNLKLGRSENRYSRDTTFTKDETFINGLSNYELVIKTDFNAQYVSMVNLVCVNENTTRVDFTSQFKPGSIIALKYINFHEFL